MRALIIWSLVLAVAIPMAARADDSMITLKDLEQEALTNNPDIRMAGQRVESAEQKSSLASAMPDPMVGYMVQNVGSPFTWSVGKQEMSMQGVLFSQEVPFPGKLSTMGLSARKQAEREQQGARETKLRVLNSLRASYYDYYRSYRFLAILEENKENVKNFQKIAETKYATGQGIQQDVLRSQLEVSMLIEKIAMEEQKREAQQAMLNGLLGRDPGAPLGRPAGIAKPALTMTLDEMSSRALAHSPVIQAKHDMVEESEYDLSLSRKQYLPDMVVSAGWFTRAEMPNVWQASVMFKVPLYFWNKSTGVKAAAADLGSAREDYNAARLMTLARLKDLYTMAKTSDSLITLYEAGILPQARLALQSATANYQVGKVDFLALLESFSTLLQYELSYEEQLVTYEKTMAQIGEVTGDEDGREATK